MRIGSLTQAFRQPNRYGGNPLPMTGIGFNPYYFQGQTFCTDGISLKIPLGGIGTYIANAPFLNGPKHYGTFTMAGVTRDSAGAALASCVVDLFEAGSDIWQQQTTSDGSGNFSFTIGGNSANYFLRAYKVGSPDLAGTSTDKLTAA